MASEGPEMVQLRQWYQEYIADDDSDSDLDEPSIEQLDIDKNIGMHPCTEIINKAPLWKQGSTPYCSQCLRNFEAWPTEELEGLLVLPETYTMIRMAEASSLGCKSCTFWLTALRKSGLIEEFYLIESRLRLLGESNAISLIAACLGSDSPQPVNAVYLGLPGKTTSNSQHQMSLMRAFEFRSPIIPSYRYDYQEDSLNTARQWLSKCLADHPSCNNDKPLGRPSRVLYIAGHDLRLCLTADWKTMPPYATLSYIWGSSDFLKLTDNNVQAFLQSIPFESLPTTLAEAVLLSRRLNLNYLWIDALCIIQGSKEDWLKESVLMRDIYGGSHITIGAAWTPTIHDGGLLSVPSYRCGFSAPVGTKVLAVYDRGSFQDYCGLLKTRAWTVQERLLSTRTLYVGKGGMRWHCQTLYALEDTMPIDWQNVGLMNPELSRHEAWDWPSIAKAYSTAQLTYGTDRLAALAGIARRQHEKLKDEYIVGMWKSDIIRALCWEVFPHIHQRPTEWRAPSWSWLSIDGRVIYAQPGHDIEEYVRFVDARIELASDDPFGPIIRGKMQLAITTLLVSEHYRRENPIRDAKSQKSLFVAVRDVGVNTVVNLDCQDDLGMTTSTSIYLLPLYATNFSDDAKLCGIALLLVDSSGQTYRRIGSFHITQSSDPQLRLLSHTKAESELQDDKRPARTIITLV